MSHSIFLWSKSLDKEQLWMRFIVLLHAVYMHQVDYGSEFASDKFLFQQCESISYAIMSHLLWKQINILPKASKQFKKIIRANNIICSWNHQVQQRVKMQ